MKLKFWLQYEGRDTLSSFDANETGAEVRQAFEDIVPGSFALDDYLLVYDGKILQNNESINFIHNETKFKLVNKKQEVILHGKLNTINITLDNAGEITVKDLRAAVEAAYPGSKVSSFRIKSDKIRDDNAKMRWFDIYQPSTERAILYPEFESLIEITFVNEVGNKIKVKLDENSSITEAKEAIAKAVNIPIDELKLVRPPEAGDKIGKEIEDTCLVFYLKNRNIAAVKKGQQVLFVAFLDNGKEGELMPFIFNPDESILDIKTRMSRQLIKTDSSNVVLELILEGFFLSDNGTAQNYLRDGSVVVLQVAQKEIEQPKAKTPNAQAPLQQRDKNGTMSVKLSSVEPTDPATLPGNCIPVPEIKVASLHSINNQSYPSQKRVPVGPNKSSTPPSQKRVHVGPPPNDDSKRLQNAALIGFTSMVICLAATYSVRFFTGADLASPKVSVPASLLIGAVTGIMAYKCQSDGPSGAQSRP